MTTIAELDKFNKDVRRFERAMSKNATLSLQTKYAKGNEVKYKFSHAVWSDNSMHGRIRCVFAGGTGTWGGRESCEKWMDETDIGMLIDESLMAKAKEREEEEARKKRYQMFLELSAEFGEPTIRADNPPLPRRPFQV